MVCTSGFWSVHPRPYVASPITILSAGAPRDCHAASALDAVRTSEGSVLYSALCAPVTRSHDPCRSYVITPNQSTALASVGTSYPASMWLTPAGTAIDSSSRSAPVSAASASIAARSSVMSRA